MIQRQGPICPYLSDGEIWAKADAFRLAHWPQGSIPVDVDLILEQMGIDIIPVPGMRSGTDTDACMDATMCAIYIDQEYYMDERMAFRVRFSLAHELGHLVLHPEVFKYYRDQEPKDILEWAELVRSIFDFEGTFYEEQANTFAGCFLVPRDALLTGIHAPLQKIVDSQLDLTKLPDDAVRAVLAKELHRQFEVSPKVIEIRLQKYQVYPSCGASRQR